MSTKYRIVVFGKTGCDKCKLLNRRLDTLLADEAWKGFEKAYCDVETEDGLVAFSRSECVNPQRIPALMVTRLNEQTGTYEPMPRRTPGEPDPACGSARLYQYVGLQTDYSEAGKGLISPKMIGTVLEEASRL